MIRRLSFAILFAAGIASPLLISAAARRWFPSPAIEMARVASPDLRHEAVIVRRQPNLPLLRPSIEVYIVRRGGKISAGDDPVLLATKTDGLRSAWKNNHLLEISYSHARVDGFTAVWPAQTVNPPSVEIQLAPPATGLSFTADDNS
jgi:hypothetical protein